MPKLFPQVSLNDSELIVDLAGPHRSLSWALVGGGLRTTSAVVWKEVRNRDLGANVDATELLQSALESAGHPHATGLLTSAPLADYRVAKASEGRAMAFAVATVGLSNALTVGDPSDTRPKAFGTINILAWYSEELSDEATIEALSIATEARTKAVQAAGVPSRVSGATATGTGTDCIVVASPVAAPQDAAALQKSAGGPAPFAGKHTLAGSLIGRTCHDAVEQGIVAWRLRSASRV